MPMIEMEAIQAYANRIAERFQPDKVILFGSYAYGQPTEDSDVDILVIMSFEDSPVQKAIEISRALGRSFPKDLVIRHTNDIEWRYEGGDPLIGDAIDKGIILYDKQKQNNPRVA